MEIAPCILIINDRQSEVWFIEQILHRLGYDTEAATDGLEALDKLKEWRPELIVLDTIMPKMDGYELYQQLLKKPETAAIPVLVLTDKGEDYERQRLFYTNRKQVHSVRNAKISPPYPKPGFLNRPIHQEELSIHIRNLLQQGHHYDVTPRDRSKARILIVDDDVRLVQSLRLALERHGVDVATAYDGLDGLNSVKQKTPDLIILDTIMPHLNGLQVLRYLRQYYLIPIVMIAGESETDLLSKAHLTGTDEYLIKPFKPSELLSLIERKFARIMRAAGRF